MKRDKACDQRRRLKERTGDLVGAVSDSKAVVFVRPHDIRITREPSGSKTFPARVIRSNAAGPVANLELARLDGGDPFTVQLSKELFQALQPKAGEQDYVERKNVRVFSDDYSI